MKKGKKSDGYEENPWDDLAEVELGDTKRFKRVNNLLPPPEIFKKARLSRKVKVTLTMDQEKLNLYKKAADKQHIPCETYIIGILEKHAEKFL